MHFSTELTFTKRIDGLSGGESHVSDLCREQTLPQTEVALGHKFAFLFHWSLLFFDLPDDEPEVGDGRVFNLRFQLTARKKCFYNVVIPDTTFLEEYSPVKLIIHTYKNNNSSI